MSVKALNRINQCIYYRVTTTTIIRHCIRYNTTTTSTLPIPGKKFQNDSVSSNNNINHKRSSPSPSQSYAPWQHRSITLHDQFYKLPELIIARIESISNAKIDIISTISPQTDIHAVNDNTNNQQEIYGNTSLLSSFYPSEYLQVTVTGDGNAVDTAIQIYIYYSQNAIPITLDTKIPTDILDAISKDCGCFIEKQNDFLYRIYPTTLDHKKDKQNMHEIEKKIRASIHRLNVPQPWYDSHGLMKLLFKYLKQKSIDNNLSFKSGGYFWYDEMDKNTQNVDIMDDMNEENKDAMEDDIDLIEYNEEYKDIGYIWTYQNGENKQIVDIENELQGFIQQFIKHWNFITLTSKTRPVLAAKKQSLWNYIRTEARNQWNIDCMISNDCILWKHSEIKREIKQDPEKKSDVNFEEFIKKILNHIVHIEINIDLSEIHRKNLNKLCYDYNLLYIIPNNEAFISYYIGKHIKDKAKIIKRSIRNIIDPLYEPQQNIMLNRVKSDQLIKIENSEKYHVIIRMLRYLNEEKGIIRDIKDIKELQQRKMDETNVYYSILPKQRSVELTIEGNVNDEEIQEKISNIYEYINNVNSVSVAIPILILLRQNKGNFANEFEEELNVILSSPPLQSIAHILKKHKNQRRLIAKQQNENNEIHSNQVMAKMYFWCKNNENDDRIQQYFDDIIYKKIDIPIPIDLLYRSSNPSNINTKHILNSVEAANYYSNKHSLICIANHPEKAVSNDNRSLKYFNPKRYDFRYWIFGNRMNTINIDKCIDEMKQSLDECPYIDLKNMAPLIQFLQIIPKLSKKEGGIRCYLNADYAKIFCFDNNDKDKFELFRDNLENEIENIQKHCISIAGHKYDDIVLFLVNDNFKRIQKIIRPKTQKQNYGFLWFNNFEKYQNEFEALNIYSENDNILKTIENEVIKDIYNNSKIFYWNKDFNIDYDYYCKNDYLQKQLKLIMKQTNTKYAIRGKRPITPSIAITNYDKYELDVAHTKLLKLLSTNPNKQIVNNHNHKLNMPSSEKHLLPKPIILK